tara:strand:- start:83 stop:670 length:588 start_codon:yes stop_codon:yes gene_type:complete
MQINYRVQTHEYNYLVLTSQVLNRLNENAIAKGYNRTLMRGIFLENFEKGVSSSEMTDRVILDGIPIECTLAMPHYHKQGKLTMPHVRACFKIPTITVAELSEMQNKNGAFIRYKSLEWRTVTIDIDGEEWENIPTVRPYAWLDIPEASTYEKEIYEDAKSKFANDAEATIEQVEEYLAQAEKDFFRSLSETEEE